MLRLKYSMPPILLVAMVLLLTGCADQASSPENIETVDVDAGLEIDTTSDQKAKARKSGLVGILPQDFPADLPLYMPASLTDFGRSSEGRPTVTLMTPHDISRVRRGLYELLRKNGWDTSGSGSRVALKKNRRRAWLQLEEDRPGTRYRFEY